MRNPDKKPRAAYCTGCNETFPKMHLLRQHRNQVACGGRFLDLSTRRRLTLLRLAREEAARKAREMRDVAGATPVPG